MDCLCLNALYQLNNTRLIEKGKRGKGAGGGGIYGKERTKCFLGDNTSVSALYSFLKKEKKQKKMRKKET